MARPHQDKPLQQRGLTSWFFAMGRELPGYFLPILGFSLVSNILLLVSPLYMLQVYDRILTSGSKDTLIWITLISVFLLGIYGAAETGRRRICSLAAEELEEKLSERVFAEFDKTHDAGGRLTNDLRVLSRIRAFFQNQTVLPFFDLPFAPFFLLVMFMMKWRATKETARNLNLKAGAKETGFSSVTKAGRQMLQILILGAGGALAITQQISPGAIVAGSIILGRALGPIDQIVGSWRGIASARSAWNQIQTTIEDETPTANYTPLPRPEALLKLDRLSISVPGNREALIRPFGFEARGGQMIAILGSNGCGKTTLLQTIAGAWTPHSGVVALGGRELHAWPSEDRGQYVGYVPQEVELLPGTVGENIARMTETESELIIDAAKKAGAHDMILSLPQGYETPVGIAGIGSLSAGQRQLIGLARAFFGNPVMILLDEPTANLDPTAVYHAISNLNKMAKTGVIILTATHDPKLIAATSSVMVVRDGGILTADTKQYLIASKPKAANAPAQPLRTVGAIA